MTRCLWTPDEGAIKNTQLADFAAYVKGHGAPDWQGDFDRLWAYSVDHSPEFWSHLWDWHGVIGDKGDIALINPDHMTGGQFFPNGQLCYAENMLVDADDRTALIAIREEGKDHPAGRRVITRHQLKDKVMALAGWMKAQGVVPGDRVAAYTPNVPEAIITMLAASTIGAIFSSCSSDFGLGGVKDRFGQIAPKILMAADGYRYNAKPIDRMGIVRDLVAALPSIEKVLIVPFLEDAPDCTGLDAVLFDTAIAESTPVDDFVRMPFNHPLYIVYSSGTTGAPKCITHGAGGTLLQHIKEHRLHGDSREGDTIFYFTTCGWMMWNWLVSGLASGCAVVLYDGSPFAKDGDVLLDALEEENISVFGVGAKYIDALEKAGKKPSDTHRLDSLRTLLSTGSPLSRHSFQWVYEVFKSDLCLSSISGGTDIISCFVLGNPILPVYAGEIQCIGLGMDVAFWDDDGQPLIAKKGELVCTTPFPCAPIGFWNDSTGERYHSAYFDRYPNVWAHGDYGEVTERGSVIIHGRSDAVLNPGGVRIGTAEIYRQVETLPEITDSVVVGQQWGDDERVILFVVVRDDSVLDADLENRVRSTIRSNTTPRHVPAVIVPVGDIPRTMSGKVSELAVKKVIHGLPVENTDALANPEALDNFKNLQALAPA